ncbi:MAG: Hpt domain-containing protein, partial [Thioalkalispiraceae bacterium]
MQQLVQSRVSLQEELSSLSAELIEAFINADTEYLKDESIYDVLRSYIKHVTRCGLCAGRSGLYELQDTFVRFQGILRSLLKHSPEVIDQYRIVLEQWPLLVMSYINSSRKPELMQQIENLLTDTVWPSHDIAEPFNINCSQDDQSQLDANNGLLEEFHSCLEDMDKLSQEYRSADSQNIKMTLEQAAAKLELFGVSAAAAGFVGLMDVAQILQSGLLTHSSIPRVLTEQEWDELITLKKVIEEYIKDPLKPEIIENVLCAIQECQLCEQLQVPEIETLRKLFTLIENDEPQTDGGQLRQESQERKKDNKQSQRGEESINASIKLNSNEESADAIPEEVSDLLGLVAAEFENVIPGFNESLHSLLDTTREDKIRQEARKQYIALLERFASVAESIGLNGLSIILVRLNTFFNQQSLDTAITPEQQLWLAEWPAYVLNYLNNPYTNADELIQHCKFNNTILNIDEEKYKQLSLALRSPNITIEEDEKEPRQTIAELNDVSLQLPEDVNQQLLDSLLQELPNHTEDFSNAIARIINGEGKLHDVEVAQRIAHTLKGSANTVGIIGIATLTHHIEDILTAFTKKQQLPQEPLTTTLQDAADILEMMSESLLGIGNVSEKQSLYVLQQVLDCANEIEQNGLPNTEHLTLNKDDLEVVEETLQHIEAKEQTTLRISTLTIDEILRLIGESIITNGQLHESLHNVLLQNQTIQEQNQLFQQLAFELEQLVDIRGINKYLNRANDDKFDSLEMDQYNELHTLSRRLVEATTDAREMSQEVDADLKHIENLLHSQSRIEKDTQELTMKTRMLPVKNIVPRLQRSVRQACRQTGKNVELEVVGSDTLIDNEILNMMADPLMHLLRNAVDHGIEASDIRNKVGKEAIGRIDLSFEREGEYIRIRCVDDGAGLDPNAIKNVAVEKGIINKDSNLSDDELYRLIILAGFTTRDQATQLSGRGIGMDAVYNQILRLKGTLKIENTMGGGACFEIQLP